MNPFNSYRDSIIIKDSVKSRHVTVGEHSYYAGYYHGKAFDDCIMYLDELDDVHPADQMDGTLTVFLFLIPRPSCRKVIMPHIENITKRPIMLQSNLFLASSVASTLPFDLFHIKVTIDQKNAATATVKSKLVTVLPINSEKLLT
jgi:hypothetical protein